MRLSSIARGLAALLTCLAAAGCYNPNVPSGKQLCSNDGKCPEGYTCFPDHHCYVNGAAPDCSPACTSKEEPICDKANLRCVQCLADKDCPPGGLCVAGKGGPFCRMGCSATHPGCASDAGSCDVDLGVCRGCLSDTECTDVANPRCDAPSGRCVPCVIANDNCPTGQYCSGANGTFSCVNGCKAKADCGAGSDGGTNSDGGVSPSLDCCNHQCVDTGADKANCGSCGKTCENGNVCCSGGCADVTTDVGNCGGCGMPCMLVNVMGPNCSASTCGFAKCSPGFGDCDLKPSNGCETNIGMDPKNCGGCGNACGPFPNAIPGCMTATCTLLSCMKGFSDCDGAVKTGCEIDSFNDVKNCGGCGNVCPNVVNGTPGCALGKCGVGTCNGAFRDCDMVAMNGCEANLLMDPKNCGGCGAPCNFANASGTCANGVCQLGTCNPGFGNCDNMPANGCETSLSGDVNNCGACLNKCAMGLSCINAKCTLVCPAGKADCDGNQANGCETSTTSDPMNCGACNSLCRANVTCVNSACSGCQTGFADCDGNAVNGCEVNLNTDAANCGKCKMACPMGTPTCASGTCTALTVVGTLGPQTFYKVPVMGMMTDTNVSAACKAAGLGVGCQAMGVCNYNDMLCVMTQEASCGNPMQTLSFKLCGANVSPSACPALYGLFQYMGHNWTTDSACGAQAGQWCVVGSTVSNQFALCVK